MVYIYHCNKIKLRAKVLSEAHGSQPQICRQQRAYLFICVCLFLSP